MTFDLDLWPTDPKRDHLLITDYLPTTFEASRAKHSWVISCTRCLRPPWTFIFDLLTWISIGIIYISRLSTYQIWSFWDKEFLSYQLQKVKGNRHTDGHTDRHVQSNILFRKGGGGDEYHNTWLSKPNNYWAQIVHMPLTSLKCTKLTFRGVTIQKKRIAIFFHCITIYCKTLISLYFQ